MGMPSVKGCDWRGEVFIDIQHRSAQLDVILPGPTAILFFLFSSYSTQIFVARSRDWDGWKGRMIEMSE